MVLSGSTTYAFPNVSFSETIVGPTPYTPNWRNTIGVAGVFSRGPDTPTLIKSRQDFAYLYGEDTSPGALLVRQAMLQGATNFMISRVMPSATPSSGSVFFVSSQGALVQPVVGSGASRTVGLNFAASYIGSPLVKTGNYIGATVATDPTQVLNIPGFSGLGYLDFQVVEQVNPAQVTASPAFAASVANIAGSTSIQIVTASGAAGTVLNANAKPGLLLSTSAAGISFGSGNVGLLILSYPFQVSSGVYGVIAQGAVTGVSGNATTSVTVSASGSAPQYFIFSYTFRNGDGNSPAPSTLLSTKSYSNAIGLADGFLTVPVNNSGYQPVYLFNNPNNVLGLLDTGIHVSITNTQSASQTVVSPTAAFSVPFIQGSVSIGEINTAASGFPNTTAAFQSGLSAAQILEQLQVAIVSNTIMNSLFADVTVNNLLLPYSLTFNSYFSGLEANRIFYTLTPTYSSGTATDLLFQNINNLFSTAIAMAGGKDGMKHAHLYLYDINGNPLVYLEATSPGVYGNGIQVTVVPLPPGQFQIQITDTSSQNFNVPIPTQTLTLNNYSVDPNTGLYLETLGSPVLRAYFVPVMVAKGQTVAQSTYDLTPQRVAPPSSFLSASITNNPMSANYQGASYLQSLSLKGGYEPVNYSVTPPSEQDFINAIADLEGTDCAFITLAGVNTGQGQYELAIAELLAQAERSTTVNGLRFAVLAAPPQVTAAQAASIPSGLASERLILVSGYSTMVGVQYLGSNQISPVGFYTGVLANTPPHISPANISQGQAVSGVLSVDSKNTPVYLDTMTRAGLEVLYYDPGLSVYKFLNGRTTSLDPNQRYISVSRMRDQIVMDLSANLIWIRSAPNIAAVRSKAASGCDAYLRFLQRQGMIYGYSPTICDESNNTPQTIATGTMNITITYTPVYPADYIHVSLVRDLTTDFSIQASASGA
jgi:hypothetical protein